MTDFVFAINNETLLISLSGWLVFLRKFTAERNKKFYGRKSSLRASRYVEKVDNRLWKINNQSLDAREDEAWKASSRKISQGEMIRQTLESFSVRVLACRPLFIGRTALGACN